MIRARLFAFVVLAANCYGQSQVQTRNAAEYYLAAYASHYGVPVEFARAVVEQESGWRICAISPKGAAGIMQLMPETAARLRVRNRCNLQENISGGIRYQAWLMQKFHGDLRLVAAAYFAGEARIEQRGLNYRNPDVIAYVAAIRERFEKQKTTMAVRFNRSSRTKP